MSSASSRRAPATLTSGQSAVAVVAGSPGMTGAAGLCAHAAYRSRGGHGPPGHPRRRPRRIPRRARPSEPSCRRGLVIGGAGHVAAVSGVVVGPGLGRADSTVADVRAVVARTTVPTVVDADGLFALGSGDEIGAVVRAPSPRTRARRPGAGHRRSCSPPTTGSSPAWPGRRPATDRIAAASALAERCGAVVLLKGPDHGRRRSGRVGAAGDGGIAPAGHGRHRRRALGRHRRLRRPGRRTRTLPRRWPRTSMAGPPRSGRPRASWRGTSPSCSADGCRGCAEGETGRVRSESAVTSRRSRALASGVGRDRRRRRPPQRLASWRGWRRRRPLCAVVKADAYGHGAVPVARAALEGGRDAGWRWRRRRRAWSCATPASTAPVLVLSEPPPEAMADVVGHGLTLALYSRPAVGRRGRGRRGAPVWCTDVHVKVDTGMHRVGGRPDDLLGVVRRRWRRQPALRFAALWTHFPVADGVRARGPRLSPTGSSGAYRGARRAGRRRATCRRCSTPRTPPGAIAYPAARLDMVALRHRPVRGPALPDARRRVAAAWSPPARGRCAPCCRCGPR